MKTGIFGGSFNPVHLGHVDIVRAAIEKYGLDTVLVVPTFISPFKPDAETIDGIHRLEMCRLAFNGLPNAEVSDFEIAKGGVSYTFNTVKHFSEKYPDDELFLIVGEDVTPTIGQWYKYDEMVKLCKIITGERRLNISSTLIRENIAKNSDNSCFLNENVLEYIKAMNTN